MSRDYERSLPTFGNHTSYDAMPLPKAMDLYNVGALNCIINLSAREHVGGHSDK